MQDTKNPNANPHAVALGALGGRACTEKQNAARRLNGRKGGRPKKVKTVDTYALWLATQDPLKESKNK